MSTIPDQIIPTSDLSAVRCLTEAIRLAADADGTEHLARLCNALLHETTQYVLAVSGGPTADAAGHARAVRRPRRVRGHEPHRSAPPAVDPPHEQDDPETRGGR